jgi:hypothetical protein
MFGKNSSLWSFNKKMKKIVLFNLQQKLPALGLDTTSGSAAE